MKVIMTIQVDVAWGFLRVYQSYAQYRPNIESLDNRHVVGPVPGCE